jgi:hypothetical protein
MPNIRLSKKSTRNWASSPQVSTPDRKPMSQKQFQAACEVLGIDDNVTAAKAFGLSWRTCQRYWYGEIEVPGPLARLLRLAIRLKMTHEDFLTL